MSKCQIEDRTQIQHTTRRRAVINNEFVARTAVETFREVRDELLNEARMRRRRVTEPSMHSWESEPNKESDGNGAQSEPSPKSPRLLSDADSTSTDWRLSGTWALHGAKEAGEVIS